MRVLFTPIAWDQFQHWLNQDRSIAARIVQLIEATRRTPFTGIGKPEPLRGELRGWWSRRINAEHRLVYRVTGAGEDQRLEVVQCRYHY